VGRETPREHAANRTLGGGAGVGFSIAQSFVLSGSKAVVILGRRKSVLDAAKKDLEALPGQSKILTFAADVVDEAALNSAFAATEEAVGKVDIVVACAGFMPDFVPAAVADIGDWWKAFEVNVLGLVLTFRAWMGHKSSQNGTPSFIYVNAGEFLFQSRPLSPQDATC
jgi:NADP-dependent 3-hydroxy acid dehydrogenase YdfG